MSGLNGVAVKRRGNTIFVPLPRESWQECGGSKCRCGPCLKLHPDAVPYYDTLAIADAPDKSRNDVTWMVHFPELQLGYRAAVYAEEVRREEARRAMERLAA